MAAGGATAVEAQGEGAVLAAEAVETHGKGAVSAAEAVEAQGKGGVVTGPELEADVVKAVGGLGGPGGVGRLVVEPGELVRPAEREVLVVLVPEGPRGKAPS